MAIVARFYSKYAIVIWLWNQPLDRRKKVCKPVQMEHWTELAGIITNLVKRAKNVEFLSGETHIIFFALKTHTHTHTQTFVLRICGSW